MRNVFPRWSNSVPLKLIIALGMTGGALVAGITYYATQEWTRVGYQPTQPVSYDHDFHAGELGLDCRYCHHSVDKSPNASIPSANVCMSCHKTIKADSPLLEPIRKSYFGEDANKDGLLSEGEDLNGDGVLNPGDPVPWVRIHKAPDYVYFNHAIHVNRGVSCVECHGRIDQMKEVHHAKSLSMSFCLKCHRNPEQKLRPMGEVTNLAWGSGGSVEPSELEGMSAKEITDHMRVSQEFSPIHAHAGIDIRKKWGVNPPLSCTGCHR
jgi:formate-dependent nitrite reductase cytochrome c552 subunit